VNAGTTTNSMAMSMDIFPTVCEIAEAKIEHTIDGVSFLPTLLGKDQPALRDKWFFRRREGGTRYAGKTIEALRWGDWKILQNSPFEPMELYNLKNDPHEDDNLANKNRAQFNKLSAALRKEIQRYGTVPWQKPISE